MAWIQQIEERDADGLLQTIYTDATRRAGRVFNILRLQSINPPTLKAGLDLYLQIMHAQSPLPRSLREMIAVVISRTNECRY